MTHLDKSIYNTYLRVSRTKQNKPFRYRKNFDKFDDDPSFVFVKKLSLFFTKFPHIKLNDFFEAPYNVYLDNSPYYDLKYYTTPKAVKVYGLYMKKRDAEDSPEPWPAGSDIALRSSQSLEEFVSPSGL